MSNKLLSINNLCVSSKEEDKEILKNLNIDINENETHVVMGPNGSGKSTLSKSIIGHPQYKYSGEIKYNHLLKEHSLMDKNPDEISLMGIFLSFQQSIELPGVTNFTFLKTIFNAHSKKKGIPEMDAIEFREHIDKYLDILKMDDSFLDRFVNQDFSGGEKKKNEILQLMILEPKLAILDEIDSGLDVDSLKLIANTVSNMKDKRSFLIITHYNRILKYIVPDYIHILIDGKIVKSGDKNLALEIEERGYSWLR